MATRRKKILPAKDLLANPNLNPKIREQILAEVAKQETVPQEQFEGYRQGRRSSTPPLEKKDREEDLRQGLREELKAAMSSENIGVEVKGLDKAAQQDLANGLLEGIKTTGDDQKVGLNKVVSTLISHFKLIETQLSAISSSLKGIAASLGIQQKQEKQTGREAKLEKQKGDVTKEQGELFTLADMKGKGVSERVGMNVKNMKTMFIEGMRQLAADLINRIMKIGLALLAGGALFQLLPDGVKDHITSALKGLWEGLEETFPSLAAFRKAAEATSEILSNLKKMLINYWEKTLFPVFYAFEKAIGAVIETLKRFGIIDSTMKEKQDRERDDYVEKQVQAARNERRRLREGDSFSEMPVPVDPETEKAADIRERDKATKKFYEMNPRLPEPYVSSGERGPLSLSKPAATPAQGSTKDIEEEVTPEGRALLNRIASTESPDYNTIYNGEKFSDMSKHPAKYVTITSGPHKGEKSSAAGRYQFNKETWDEFSKKAGVTDFSPASQDKAAWRLAQEQYRKETGGSLQDALKKGDRNTLNNISTALAPRWTSLAGGKEPSPQYAEGKPDFATRLQADLGRSQAASLEPSTPTSAMQMTEASEQVAMARQQPQVMVLPSPQQASQVQAPPGGGNQQAVFIPIAIANRGSLDREIHMSTLTGAA